VIKVDWMYELMNEKKEFFFFFSSRVACGNKGEGQEICNN
jgi:hypothetical protein